MSRARPSGRVTPRPERGPDEPLPSYRKRKPVVYWFVIVAVLAMLLTTFAGLLSAIG